MQASSTNRFCLPATTTRALLPLVTVVLMSLPVLSGCYFTRSPSRPLPGLTFRQDPDARQPCLVIFIPGYLDGPDTYREHGFPRMLQDTGAACDSVAVDLHSAYYAQNGVAAILYEDILAPAVARGYEEIWLVGISMGGLGASLLMREYSQYIDGVILLSPFLGDPATIAQISEAGGLDEWEPPELPDAPSESNYTLFIWSFLRGYQEDPEDMPPLWLAWADGEALARPAQLLAEVLEESHTLHGPGAHNWRTWTPLFAEFLERAHPGI